MERRGEAPFKAKDGKRKEGGMREDRGRANGISRFVCIESRRKGGKGRGYTRHARWGQRRAASAETRKGRKKACKQAEASSVSCSCLRRSHVEMPWTVILQGEDISEDKETSTAPQTMQINWKACNGQGDK